MNKFDWISILAFLISALSALYARWSALEAKKANKISLQFEKVEIYKEVVSFSDCFRGLFSVPTPERLERFLKKAVDLSEIYFSKEIYSQLDNIYDHCNNSEMYLSVVQDNKDDKFLPSELEIRSEYKSVLDLLYPVIEDIKSDLKINA